MHFRHLILLAGIFAGTLVAAEVQIGSTKEQVIAGLGKPKSTVAVGAREILIYGESRIVLENGQVVRVEQVAPLNQIHARPVSKPAALHQAPKISADDGEWLTDFPAALAEAGRENRRILALFTGTDWCPPCKRFEAEVAHNPQFLAKVQGDFILVKLDYPRHHDQPADLKEFLEKLRQTYGVNSYPTLMIISTDGSKALRLDTGAPRSVTNVLDYFIQAVDEGRNKEM